GPRDGAARRHGDRAQLPGRRTRSRARRAGDAAPAEPGLAMPRNGASPAPAVSTVRDGASAASDRLVAGLAGTDPVHLLQRGHENLAVADLAGLRGLDDRLDHALDELVGNRDLDLHLRQEV